MTAWPYRESEMLVWCVSWVLWMLIALFSPRAVHGPRARPVLPAAATVRANRKPEWVARQLVLLKAHLHDAGCRTIADTFNRVFAHREVSVSKSFVHGVLRQHAHEVWLTRKAMRNARPRAAAINHCWGIEMTGKVDEAGQLHTMLGIVDHGSRRALALPRLASKCAWTLLGHVCLAIDQFGKPRFVRTDNERCFTGRVFTTGLRWLGIGHQRIDLQCPWQNGRVERFFGTLKSVLGQLRPVDGAGLNGLLGDFTRWYNEVRPHQNLGGLTPLEAWHGIDPFHAPMAPRAVEFVQDWGGLLKGFRIRR